MKRRIIYSIVLAVFVIFTANAQNTFNQILRSVESNNTTLKAFREKASAEKIGNKTGLNPNNPEFDFTRLWGSSASESYETDFSLKQSFDFPTAYKYKSQLAQEKNKQVDFVYDQQAIDILQQARLLCVELTYQSKINQQFVDRYNKSKSLAEAYQKRFDQGDIDILELNKTKLSLLTAEKVLQINEVEIKTLNAELQRLNGGEPIIQSGIDYPIYVLPLNFGEWFETVKDYNPSLKQAQQDIVLSRKQEQLTRALNLPKLSAGYSRQDTPGAFKQGIIVGVSIPLWEGKNTVKHQKAQTIALQVQEEDNKLQFYNSLKNQFDKASNLSVMLQEFGKMNLSDNQQLLQKALDKGQLSLINYLLELSSYYEITDKYLETEREYQLAVAELEQWER